MNAPIITPEQIDRVVLKAKQHLAEWSTMDPEAITDYESLIRFACTPRELDVYAEVFARHCSGLMREDGHLSRTDLAFYHRQWLVAEAARCGMLLGKPYVPTPPTINPDPDRPKGPRMTWRYLVSIASAIGCPNPFDLLDFAALYRHDIPHKIGAVQAWDGDRYPTGWHTITGTRWVPAKDGTCWHIISPPSWAAFTTHLMGAPFTVLGSPAISPSGTSPFFMVDLDLHEDVAFVPRPASSTAGFTMDTVVTRQDPRIRIEQCAQAFQARPASVVTSPNGLYAIWLIPEQVQLAPRKAVEVGRQILRSAGVQFKAGWIELPDMPRVPLGFLSRPVDPDTLQPFTPMSWKSKGEDLARFWVNVANKSRSPDEQARHIVPPDVIERALRSDALTTAKPKANDVKVGSSRPHPSKTDMTDAERLLTEGLTGPHQRLPAMLTMTRYFFWANDGDVEATAEATWTWISERHNGQSHDMNTRPDWVQQESCRMARGWAEQVRAGTVMRRASSPADLVATIPRAITLRDAEAIAALGLAHGRFGDYEAERFIAFLLAFFRQVGQAGPEPGTLVAKLSTSVIYLVLEKRRWEQVQSVLKARSFAGVARPVLTVLEAGQERRATTYVLGLPASSGEPTIMPSHAASVLSLYEPPALQQRYGPADLRRLKRDAADTSACWSTRQKGRPRGAPLGKEERRARRDRQERQDLARWNRRTRPGRQT